MDYAKMHNWDDFRYFLAVANYGSYSVAARHLAVNHSTVSRRIQALEAAHGVRLFERNQQGYSMTEAGASIYDIIVQLHNDSQKASRILQGQDATLEGKINLTMPHDVFEFILAQPLNQFSGQHPGINFNLMVSNGLRNMANREADLAVRITAKPPEYLIGSEVTRLQHGFYTSNKVVQQDHTPIIIWGGSADIPDWAFEHFHRPKIALQVDDLFSMHQAVKAGFGIARMPCFLPDIIADPAITRLPHLLPLSNWGVWILSHEDLRSSAKINQCRTFLKNTLKEHIPLFTGQLSLPVKK